MADDANPSSQPSETLPAVDLEDAPAPDEMTTDEQEHDAIVDEFLAGRDAELQPLVKAETAATAPAQQQTPSTAPATPQAAPAAPPPSLADADKDLCKRWQMSDDDIAAVQALPAAVQQRVLGSLRDRTQYVDRIAAEYNQFKQQQPTAPGQPQRPGQPQQPPPGGQPQQPPAFVSPDDAWKPLQEAYGADGFVEPFRKGVEATVQAAIQNVMQQLQPALQAPQQQGLPPDVQQYLERQQIEQAISQLQLPDGVELTPEVRKQLEVEAYKCFNGDFDLLNRNWTHTIPEAASRLFNVQAIQAERSRRSQAATRSRRGSAETGTRPANSRPQPLDPEAELDAQVESVLKAHGLQK